MTSATDGPSALGVLVLTHELGAPHTAGPVMPLLVGYLARRARVTVVSPFRRFPLVPTPAPEWASSVNLMSLGLRPAQHHGGGARRSLSYVTALKRLRSIAGRVGSDVIVSNLSLMLHELAGLADALHVVRGRLVLRVANPLSIDLSGRGTTSRRLIRIALDRCDVAIANSPGVADDLRQLHSRVAAKIHVLPNPVDIEHVRRLSDEPLTNEERRFVNQLSRPLIVTVGRLADQKNHTMLLEALASLRESIDASLMVIGDGPLRADLEERVRCLGLVDHVWFTGWRASPHRLVKESDVFALTSRFEGFGSVLVEAMALGIPVVSTDAPSGPRYVLDNGSAGVLVGGTNPKVFGEAIKNVLTDELLYRDLARSGRERADEFDAPSVLHRYWQIVSGAPRSEP